MPRRYMLCIPDKISLACMEFLHHRDLSELEHTGITASSQLKIRKKNVFSKRTELPKKPDDLFSSTKTTLSHRTLHTDSLGKVTVIFF